MTITQQSLYGLTTAALAFSLLGSSPAVDDTEAPARGDTPPPVLANVEPTGEQLIESFDLDDWHENPSWLDYRTIDVDRGLITTNGYHGSGLDVTIPPGARRGSGALYLLPEELDEAWFRYHISLDDWAALDSGKLPGFADIGASTARGCKPSTTEDPGWSARVLYEEPGTEGAAGDDIRLGYYTYHLNQPGSCGEFMPWSDAGVVSQDRWYCIEGRVAMNTPGFKNGNLTAWVDGTLAFHTNTIAFRRVGEEGININSFWLNVYFGGSTIVNDTHLGVRIDELVIDTQRVGCLTRFTDDDESPHEASIEMLFDRGILFGCAQNLFCPDNALKRSEMIALIDRFFVLPDTTEDFFADDDGHWAETVLNRAAAAGVLTGCGDRTACPNAVVTRAETAAFIDRAFGIPDSEVDFFADDTGSIFEGNINAIAAVGITSGCEVQRYCPDRAIPRDQAAALFARAITWYQATYSSSSVASP